MRGDHRFDEEADRVLAKMRRDITDAQRPLARAKVVVRSSGCRERLGVARCPGTVFVEQRGGIAAGVEVERVEQLAVPSGTARLELDDPAIGGDRRVELAAVLVGHGDFAPRRGRVALQAHRAPCRRQGPVGLEHPRVGHGHVEPGGKMRRVKRHDLLVFLNGRGPLAYAAQRRRQVEMPFGVVGFQRDRTALPAIAGGK